MAAIALVGNQPGQAYGQDGGGGLLAGSVLKATVVQNLGDNLYLLNIGDKTIEASVAADLQEGVEYQLVVEKNGSPPQLALLNEKQPARDQDGLTPKESRFVNKFINLMGESSEKVVKGELLNLIRSLGYDVDDSAEAVYQKLKEMMALIKKIDAVSPAVRQTLAQTLLFTMQTSLIKDGHGAAFNQEYLENTIKLSGEVPKWSGKESTVLAQLKELIQQLPPDQAKDLRSLLLGLHKNPNAEQQLADKLKDLMSQVKNTKGGIEEKNPQDRLRTIEPLVNKIRGDINSRFFLGSAKLGSGEAPLSIGSNIDRQTAIHSFQQQAPGLADKSISSLLEQFVSLGGKLEKLSFSDVLSAKMAWKGNSPSALQVHRTGALLYLSQDLPAESRSFQDSGLLAKGKENQLPIILDKQIINDPSGSSQSMKNMKEFSGNNKFANSYNVARMVQIWNKSGGTLQELRPQVESIKAWDQFVEQYSSVREKLVNHLLKNPVFVSQVKAEALAQSGASGSSKIMPQTQQALAEGLEQNGLKSSSVSGKAVQEAQAAIQQVAGEGQSPPKALVSLAAWMLSKNIEVNAKNLGALFQFQNGHSKAKELLQGLQQLKSLMGKMPEELKNVLTKSWLDVQDGAKDLKGVISMYQKGNGLKLQQALMSLARHVQGLPVNNDNQQMLMLISNLMGHLKTQEEFLSGLKQYNIQAQRNDTPQVYEIPVSFGEDMEKAFIKVFKRNNGIKENGKEDNYKVVIDLDLEGLGKVRSEVSMFNKHLQLDFLSAINSSLEALKKDAPVLKDRMEALDLNANMGFKLKKDMASENMLSTENSLTVPMAKSAIDLSA